MQKAPSEKTSIMSAQSKAMKSSQEKTARLDYEDRKVWQANWRSFRLTRMETSLRLMRKSRAVIYWIKIKTLDLHDDNLN